MAQQMPAGLWLSGEEVCILNDVVRHGVAALARRNGGPTRPAVVLAEAIRRVAEQFQVTVLTERQHGRSAPGSGSADDSSGSVAPVSFRSDDRLTARQVARLADVSEEFVRRLACEGVLHGTKSGHRGAWLLDPLSVVVWMAGRKTAA